MIHGKWRMGNGAIFTVIALSLGGCEKFALDRQMEELCKKDGGVKVYTTVTLSSEMFDNLGHPFPGWPNRSQEERLGSDYRYVVERVILKQGDAMKGEGELRRTVERVFRRSDNKLLGEQISYGRSGGDFIAFAHPTSKHCPVIQSDSEGLIKSIFRKKGE